MDVYLPCAIYASGIRLSQRGCAYKHIPRTSTVAKFKTAISRVCKISMRFKQSVENAFPMSDFPQFPLPLHGYVLAGVFNRGTALARLATQHGDSPALSPMRHGKSVQMYVKFINCYSKAAKTCSVINLQVLGYSLQACNESRESITTHHFTDSTPQSIPSPRPRIKSHKRFMV